MTRGDFRTGGLLDARSMPTAPVTGTSCQESCFWSEKGIRGSGFSPRSGIRPFVILVCLFVFSGLASAAPGTEAVRLFFEARYEEARSVALQSIRENPRDVDAYVGLAWSLVELGRYADADNYARKGISIRKDPRLGEALGEAAFHLGNNTVALEGLRSYIAAFPESRRTGRAYFYVGEVYLRLGKYMHADIALTAAVRFVPENASWWSRLGWIREKAGRLSQARIAYETALALDPRLSDAIVGRRRLLENQ